MVKDLNGDWMLRCTKHSLYLPEARPVNASQYNFFYIYGNRFILFQKTENLF